MEEGREGEAETTVTVVKVEGRMKVNCIHVFTETPD